MISNVPGRGITPLSFFITNTSPTRVPDNIAQYQPSLVLFVELTPTHEIQYLPAFATKGGERVKVGELGFGSSEVYRSSFGTFVNIQRKLPCGSESESWFRVLE